MMAPSDRLLHMKRLVTVFNYFVSFCLATNLVDLRPVAISLVAQRSPTCSLVPAADSITRAGTTTGTYFEDASTSGPVGVKKGVIVIVIVIAMTFGSEETETTRAPQENDALALPELVCGGLQSEKQVLQPCAGGIETSEHRTRTRSASMTSEEESSHRSSRRSTFFPLPLAPWCRGAEGLGPSRPKGSRRPPLRTK
ncbi:hypothetical protein BC827DRAFT_585542 [Russula dissimulans]|nr:hypothetical protein BC827DRAFT_585542 [Russula dissimulans]